MSCRYALAIFASLSLTACGSGNMADLEEYVQQVKARDPQPIAPLHEIKQIDTFVFEPGERRDPFVLDTQSAESAALAQVTGIAPNPERRKEELEQYSLDSLKMVGTLEQDDTIWGLIMTPEGTLHRVRSGNYIGQNNGQINRVTEEGLELTEIVSEGGTEWRERSAAIALSQ
jgi:type IV pilus assembly protein PilP